MFKDINDVRQGLGRQQYIASEEISTVVYLAQSLSKPVLTEGPAGVGKTECQADALHSVAAGDVAGGVE